MEEKVYKVVRKMPDGTLISAMGNVLPHGVPAEYTPGETTLPTLPGSCLFAFGSRSTAWAFVAHRRTGLEIWRATAVVSQMPTRKIPSPWTSWSKLRDFWETRWLWGWEPLPAGTVFCDSITLTEQVVRTEG